VIGVYGEEHEGLERWLAHRTKPSSPEDMDADQEFETFYRATAPRLVGQLLALTGDLHEAEDMVQEAFVRASVRWSRISAYDQPEAWVRRVAVNLATNELRRAKRQLAALLRLGPPPPVSALSAEEIAVTQALAGLPLRYRQVLVLHYLMGLSVNEIAYTLRVPTGTVKGRLSRGRNSLAAQLGDQAEQDVGDGYA
jgi:RNA polymerase sigma-70 factor, ECF subfamily